MLTMMMMIMMMMMMTKEMIMMMMMMNLMMMMMMMMIVMMIVIVMITVERIKDIDVMTIIVRINYMPTTDMQAVCKRSRCMHKGPKC